MSTTIQNYLMSFISPFQLLNCVLAFNFIMSVICNTHIFSGLFLGLTINHANSIVWRWLLFWSIVIVQKLSVLHSFLATLPLMAMVMMMTTTMNPPILLLHTIFFSQFECNVGSTMTIHKSKEELWPTLSVSITQPPQVRAWWIWVILTHLKIAIE